MKLRFSTKLIAMTTFLVVFSVAISTITAYYYKRKSLERALANELLGIVNSVSTFVDGSQHDLIMFDEILGEIDNEAYLKELRTLLLKVETKNHKIVHQGHSAIYTLRRAGELNGIEHLEFIGTSRPSTVIKDGQEVEVYSTFNSIPAETFQLEALKGKSVTTGLYEDQAGVWISAAAPITVPIPNGDHTTLQVVGIVQADFHVDSFYDEIQSQTVPLIGGAVAGIILAALLSYWFERRMTRPIDNLSTAARKIGEGDLDHTVTVDSSDELGDLAQSFNQMIEGLKERNLVESTFKRYVSSDVVDYLLENPDAMSRPGERRYISILFSDLQGFTSLAQRTDPREIIHLLNTYLGDVSEAIGHRGGTLDKYMGDGVMAFFGAPKPRMNHAQRSAQAALDHLAITKRLAAEHKEEGWPKLHVRVGLHTGDMIVGNIGGEGNQDYTVIGDAVNIGSRLEAANKIYGTQILCSDETWEHCREDFVGREIDTLTVVGRAKPIHIFEIIMAKEDESAHESFDLSTLHQAINTYEEGLKLYRFREFEAARVKFESVLHIRHEDGPAAEMIRRCKDFITSPPPTNWDGSWHQEIK